MRDIKETLEWYRSHEVYPGELSFDPDGMCMKICRTARGLPAMFPSALASQLATPEKYQIEKPDEIKVGMVGYYDDPNDDNPFGHIVTYVGRVKGEDPHSLRSLLCRTNSVQSNKIVVVRGDYFHRMWGDYFQFASPWMNGQVLAGFGGKKKKPLGKATNLKNAAKMIEGSIDFHRGKGNMRLVAALERDLDELNQTIKKFSKKEKKK